MRIYDLRFARRKLGVVAQFIFPPRQRSPPTGNPMVRREIQSLVCFAVKEEAKPFLQKTAGRAGLEVIITGMGGPNAERKLGEALTQFQPARVFTCGFAGGLNPDLDLGAVLFETTDGALAEALQAAGARPGKIHCASRVAVTIAEKQQFRAATGADVVEMESGVIQAVCRARGIPCATVRVISDTAHEDLPLDFNQLSRPDQNLDLGKLAWTLTKSPGKIPDLLRLQQNCALAATRLAEVLACVV